MRPSADPTGKQLLKFGNGTYQPFTKTLQVWCSLEACVPAQLDVHWVVDNYATHKHPKVRTWLAQRPRFHMHYTHTYASWLNQVERWFGLITQRTIRHDSFRSVKELMQKIDDFAQHYNCKQRPFIWTATADSILQKIARLC